MLGLASVALSLSGCGDSPDELGQKALDYSAGRHFTPYWLGDSYGGEPLTDVSTNDDIDQPGSAYSATYGDCDPTPPPGETEGGCIDPYSVAGIDVCKAEPPNLKRMLQLFPQSHRIDGFGGADAYVDGYGEVRIYTGRMLFSVTIDKSKARKVIRVAHDLRPIDPESLAPDGASDSFPRRLPCP